MGGGATLGDSLVDSLVPVVDDLRASLLPAFGVRQHRVYLVTRTWSGGRIGEGEASDEAVEIEPRPALAEPRAGYRNDPGGRAEDFDLTASEVSLTYTEADLTGGAIGDGVEFFWRVEDGEGQEIPARFYVPAGPPTPDRESTIGWRVNLRRVRIEASDDPPPPEP